MRRGIVLVGAVALLAACAHPTAGDPPDPNVPEPTAPRQCDAAKAGVRIGEPTNAALLERARKASGASIARALRPGEMVTMEYRVDRLSLSVDEAGRITAIRCG